VTESGERTVLNDRYEIESRIGRGGMADVLLARDLLLDRPVAIKVLFAEFATDPNFVERFRREAQAAANLNHPNIVGVYDWGKYGGTYFIAMEYVQGRTLADIVHSNGRVSAVQAAEIASEVAAALGFAHRNGVVHRDIKPANILIGSSGQVKVADFGIARAMNSAADSNLTQVGLVMGTATYFSPEQAQGAQPDPRSDLYSLGIVLYEMVGGKPPFSGDNPVSIAYKQVHEAPQPLNQIAPDVPKPFEAIVAKLLAKNPAHRYPDGEALRDDLRRFRNGEPVRALAEMMGAAGAAAAGAAVAAGAAGAAGAVKPSQPKQPIVVGTTASVPVSIADPSATALMPRTQGVPGQYPTGSNEAVYYDPPPRRGWYGIAAFVAVVLLIIGGFVLFKALSKDSTASSFAMPNVINLPLDQATKLLTDRGLNPVGVPKADASQPEGVVYLTDPGAGVIVSKAQTISLTYNPKNELVAVPDVTTMSLLEARNKLVGAGFVVGTITYADNPAIPDGSVISQTPAALEMAKQDSVVSLVVSQGKGKVTVPDVVGQSGTSAKSLLESAVFGFTVTITSEPNDSVPLGSVIRTNPAVDAQVDKGSALTLFVSSGPTQVAVPPAIGLKEDQARALIASKGLITAPVIFQDVPFGSANDGRVLSISPAPGVLVNSSSTVTLTVGKALPAPTTTTTTTLPPTTTTTAPATTTTVH
jgi:serine/threonine-protein kinase